MERRRGYASGPHLSTYLCSCECYSYTKLLGTSVPGLSTDKIMSHSSNSLKRPQTFICTRVAVCLWPISSPLSHRETREGRGRRHHHRREVQFAGNNERPRRCSHVALRSIRPSPPASKVSALDVAHGGMVEELERPRIRVRVAEGASFRLF